MPWVQFITAPAGLTLPFSITLQLLAAGCSALLTVGLWTPIAGSLMAAVELSLLIFHFSSSSMHIVMAALGVALAMIGPGAWSVDARLFGRKRIQLPQR
jgi:uncharacterized membrane protein YphA (DoxX/SURF4 family)